MAKLWLVFMAAAGVCVLSCLPAAAAAACPAACSCLGAIVDCSKAGLRAVPRDLPGWVEELVHGRHDASFSSTLEAMDDLLFFNHLRLSRDAFNYLHDLLQEKEPVAITHSRGKEKIPLRECLFITLWYLVNKTTFRCVSLQFKISCSSASRIFFRTLEKICNLSSIILQWPSDLDKTEEEFEAIAGFPGVIGAIDGTHIEIFPPAHHNEYLDRSMNHSITLLAVCDANTKFTYIAAGFPGSIHDQRCLSRSALGDGLKSCPNNYFPRQNVHLLGDSAFTMQMGMMVPFKDHGALSPAKKNYNEIHSQTRVVIEHAFGLLKERFRCLLKLEVDWEKMSQIVTACCILHNIALMFPDGLVFLPGAACAPQMLHEEPGGHETDLPNPNAEEKRQAICTFLAEMFARKQLKVRVR